MLTGMIASLVKRVTCPRFMYHLLSYRYSTFSSLKRDSVSWKIMTECCYSLHDRNSGSLRNHDPLVVILKVSEIVCVWEEL